MTILPTLRRAGLGQQRAEDDHAGLHRIGGQQHFGDEQDAVAEVDADDPHALDQRLGQRVIGRPAALQQDVDGHLDLFLEAVIEVVMHLLNEIVVVQAVEIEFAGVVRHRSPVLRNLAARSHSPWSGAGRRVPGEARIGKISTGFPTVAAAPPRHVLKRARQPPAGAGPAAAGG